MDVFWCRNQKEWMKETWRRREKEIAEEKGNRVEDDLGRREDKDEFWKDEGVEKTERRHRVFKK